MHAEAVCGDADDMVVAGLRLDQRVKGFDVTTEQLVQVGIRMPVPRDRNTWPAAMYSRTRPLGTAIS